MVFPLYRRRDRKYIQGPVPYAIYGLPTLALSLKARVQRGQDWAASSLDFADEQSDFEKEKKRLNSAFGWEKMTNFRKAGT